MTRDAFTTGDVARVCRVCPKTAAKWIDAGRLTGFRLPGSRDRRVTRAALLAFMAANGIPTDLVPAGAPDVLPLPRAGDGPRKAA